PAAPAPVAASGRGGLPALPGIDVTAGLATTMDNEGLYTRLLVRFREGQARFAEELRAAVAGRDPSAATRAAHTLKGTAGSIGARGVAAAAAALEEACAKGAASATLDALISEVMSALQPVLDGLAAVGTPAATAPAADPARVRALRERL